MFLAFYLAGIAAWVWLWARYSFTLETVVIDGARAGQSFGLSASLVRRSWWRVFAARVLFALMLGFAASLVATPIVFFATIKAYARYLSGMLEGTADTDSLLEMIRTMGSGLPLRLAILVYLQGLLNAFFAPVFMTLLYLERKRRASEASAADPAAAAACRRAAASRAGRRRLMRPTDAPLDGSWEQPGRTPSVAAIVGLVLCGTLYSVLGGAVSGAIALVDLLRDPTWVPGGGWSTCSSPTTAGSR